MYFWVGDATGMVAPVAPALAPGVAADADKPRASTVATVALEFSPPISLPIPGALGRVRDASVFCAVAATKGNARVANKALAAMVRRIVWLDLSLMMDSLSLVLPSDLATASVRSPEGPPSDHGNEIPYQEGRLPRAQRCPVNADLPLFGWITNQALCVR
jgi:hypothetical protein